MTTEDTTTPSADEEQRIMQVFAEERRQLEKAGPPDTVAAPGTAFPRAELIAADGTEVSSAAVLADSPTVVVFYRGLWCPHCNLALRGYQNDLIPALDERNVKLVAISPQRPDASLTMQRNNALTFTVLSDPANQIATALGILTAPSAQARETQLSLGFDLTQANADGTTSLPIPTVAVVDAEGILRWIDARPNYAARTEAKDVIAAVDAILQ